MLPLHRLARRGTPQVAVALLIAGSWLSGCGDDPKPSGAGGSSGKGGSAGAGTGGATAGSAGSVSAGTGGSTAGSAGSAGAAMAGSAGSLGGSAGSAGTGGEAGIAEGGMAGEIGTAGEGGAGTGGTGGTSGTAGTSGSSGTAGTAGTEQGGQGGEGGSSSPLCLAADLDIEEVSSNPNQQHDHMPVTGANLTTLVNMINAGTPLTFALPTEGMNPHSHQLTFTAQQLTVLRNGGALAMNVTSATGGPAGNQHTHTYSLDCEP